MSDAGSTVSIKHLQRLVKTPHEHLLACTEGGSISHTELGVVSINSAVPGSDGRSITFNVSTAERSLKLSSSWLIGKCNAASVLVTPSNDLPRLMEVIAEFQAEDERKEHDAEQQRIRIQKEEEDRLSNLKRVAEEQRQREIQEEEWQRLRQEQLSGVHNERQFRYKSHGMYIPVGIFLTDDIAKYLDSAIDRGSFEDRPGRQPIAFYRAKAIWFQKLANEKISYKHLAIASSSWRKAEEFDIAIRATENATRDKDRDQAENRPHIADVLTSRAGALCDKFVSNRTVPGADLLILEAIECNDRARAIEDSYHPYMQLMRTYGVRGDVEMSNWALKQARRKHAPPHSLQQMAKRTVREAEWDGTGSLDSIFRDEFENWDAEYELPW